MSERRQFHCKLQTQKQLLRHKGWDQQNWRILFTNWLNSQNQPFQPSGTRKQNVAHSGVRYYQILSVNGILGGFVVSGYRRLFPKMGNTLVVWLCILSSFVGRLVCISPTCSPFQLGRLDNNFGFNSYRCRHRIRFIYGVLQKIDWTGSNFHGTFKQLPQIKLSGVSVHSFVLGPHYGLLGDNWLAVYRLWNRQLPNFRKKQHLLPLRS